MTMPGRQKKDGRGPTRRPFPVWDTDTARLNGIDRNDAGLQKAELEEDREDEDGNSWKAVAVEATIPRVQAKKRGRSIFRKQQ